MKQNLVLALDAKRARLPDPDLASIRTSGSNAAFRLQEIIPACQRLSGVPRARRCVF